MESLKNLINNVPDWVKRLDELTGQIDQRQLELAQLSESASCSSGRMGSSKSLRHRGSTESLKPRDDPPAHPFDPVTAIPPKLEPSPPLPPLQNPAASPGSASANDDSPDPPPPASPAGSHTPSALLRQTQQVMQVAQAKARATVRRRQRTESMISAEGGPSKYRSRSMIIVYYDSYVQSFFEELVKFVSASRNMMRKAKMAAKVAQIKRLAELVMPDGPPLGMPTPDDDNGAFAPTLAGPAPLVPGGEPLLPDAPLEAASQHDGDAEAELDLELPGLRYVSSRGMHSAARAPQLLLSAGGRPRYARAAACAAGGGRTGFGLDAAKPDVYDDLDKGLEYAQSMCEHAAHQFLRDGDCTEEIGHIKRRLAETKDLADREMERLRTVDPEALGPPEEPLLTRSFRPQSMRRDAASAHSGSSGTGAAAAAAAAATMATKRLAAADKPPEPADVLEVDEGFDDMGDSEFAIPKLEYRSTRQLR